MSETQTPLFIQCCYYMLRKDKCTTEAKISEVLKQNFGTAFSAPMTELTAEEGSWIRPFIYPAPDTATTRETYYSERIKRAGALLLHNSEFQSKEFPSAGSLMEAGWQETLSAALALAATQSKNEPVATTVTAFLSK